ncbi:ATP-dependent sacrificial sulfur transferase LarE, partial [bacterium]|nr:ATP-dependent sacrificial sulfur transferase LarE [bacterium]
MYNEQKLQHLKKILVKMESVLIAYSGGVDSAFLVKVAKDVLDDDKVVAVTATSLTYPANEIKEAETIAKGLKARHLVIKTDELSNQKFTENSTNRCYWCKKELFSKLIALAKEYRLNYVLDGSNYDDAKDFRPGMRAVEKLGVRSPLKEAGFTKDEIRSLSERLGLLTWNKPSLACLASRFPYGMKITKENLAKVDKAETLLRKFGITQVRVRHHDKIARIEIPKNEISKLLKENVRDKIITKFKELGYTYVTVDLEGYRTGSMNEK